jgi:hypothetical protein
LPLTNKKSGITVEIVVAERGIFTTTEKPASGCSSHRSDFQIEVKSFFQPTQLPTPFRSEVKLGQTRTGAEGIGNSKTEHSPALVAGLPGKSEDYPTLLTVTRTRHPGLEATPLLIRRTNRPPRQYKLCTLLRVRRDESGDRLQYLHPTPLSSPSLPVLSHPCPTERQSKEPRG